MSPRRPVREIRPEPSRGWVRYVPRRWPAPETPWVDLSRSSLGKLSGGEEDLEALAAHEVDGVLYVPPVRRDLRAVRDRVVAAHRDRGAPVLVQLLPGEPAPEVPGLLARDLLLPVLRGEEIRAADLDLSTCGIWPLLPGSTAELDLPPGTSRVLPLALELDPKQRRALAEELPDPDRGWGLFHGEPPSLEESLEVLFDRGIHPYLPRPLPDDPWPGRTNLRLAAALALAGELCLHLAEAPPRAETFRRAARFVDDSPHDLEALARDGNLAVLPWLEEEPKELVAWLLEHDDVSAADLRTWLRNRPAPRIPKP